MAVFLTVWQEINFSIVQFVILKGMMGALAPLSYLVFYIFYKLQSITFFDILKIYCCKYLLIYRV